MRIRWEYTTRPIPGPLEVQVVELNRLGTVGWEFLVAVEGKDGVPQALLKRRVIPKEDVR